MTERSDTPTVYFRQLADWANAQGEEPAAAVAGLAAFAAQAEHWPAAARTSMEDLTGGRTPAAIPVPPPHLELSPNLLGQLYEALLDRTARRAQGAFFTPPGVARRLVNVVIDAPGRNPAPSPTDETRTPAVGGPVIDPAVGGGAFLLAAADKLLAGGDVRPTGIVSDLLHGADVDATAVAITRLGLAWWAWHAEGGGAWPERAGRHVVTADALLDDGAWPDPDPARPGIVVGNPPFLSQLSRRTARTAAVGAQLVDRLGPVAGGYVDSALLFLLAACRHRPAGCRIGLILPESVLVTAHAGAARRAVLTWGRLVGLWLGGAGVFGAGAGVRVCAPIVELVRPDGTDPPDQSEGPAPLPTWRGPCFEPAAEVRIAPSALATAPTWGSLTAELRGVPALRPADTGRLGDLVTATAGFRDQFYGLVPHVRDACVRPGSDRRRTPPLVTSGLIDPATCLWGERPARFAGRSLAAPVVDRAGLDATAPTLGAWVAARLRPKVLVATQGRVLEAVADPAGELVPSVPVVSVEPVDPGDVWKVLAVLLSPVATSWALEHYGGAGLAGHAVKLSARQILAIPTPRDDVGWAGAAAHCRLASEADDPLLRRHHLRIAAGFSVGAFGLETSDRLELLAWWERRVAGSARR